PHSSRTKVAPRTPPVQSHKTTKPPRLLPDRAAFRLRSSSSPGDLRGSSRARGRRSSSFGYLSAAKVPDSHVRRAARWLLTVLGLFLLRFFGQVLGLICDREVFGRPVRNGSFVQGHLFSVGRIAQDSGDNGGVHRVSGAIGFYVAENLFTE